jgi:hypothetical protein
MKSIYELELHEVLNLDVPGGSLPFPYVMRVPGGWIYFPQKHIDNKNVGIFVPFNDEFVGRAKLHQVDDATLYKLK